MHVHSVKLTQIGANNSKSANYIQYFKSASNTIRFKLLKCMQHELSSGFSGNVFDMD